MKALRMFVFLAAASILWSGAATGQQPTAPKLTLSQVEELVSHHVPDSTMSTQIQRRGLAFTPGPAIIESLHAKGAGPLTLEEIEALLPKVIRSAPTSRSKPSATESAVNDSPSNFRGAPSAAADAAPFELRTNREKGSYAIAMSIAKSLQREGVDVDSQVFLRGIKDLLAGGKALLTDDEAKGWLTELQKEAKARQEARTTDNKREGEAFLAANRARDGVVTLPSGLQYKVLKQGYGPKPSASDTVQCNYRGTLVNGKEFDSSYKRGQPAEFPVAKVIKGWTEVLQLMPVGSKYQVFIPADLAYGQSGAGNDIGPNANLIFEIELLSIKD